MANEKDGCIYVPLRNVEGTHHFDFLDILLSRVVTIALLLLSFAVSLFTNNSLWAICGFLLFMLGAAYGLIFVVKKAEKYGISGGKLQLWTPLPGMSDSFIYAPANYFSNRGYLGSLPAKSELSKRLLSDSKGEYVLLPVTVVRWMKKTEIKFYASHKDFLEAFSKLAK